MYRVKESYGTVFVPFPFSKVHARISITYEGSLISCRASSVGIRSKFLSPRLQARVLVGCAVIFFVKALLWRQWIIYRYHFALWQPRKWVHAVLRHAITDSVGGSLGPHSRTNDTSTETTQVVADASLTICILTF